MNHLRYWALSLLLALVSLPFSALAAGSITPSGGGKYVVGQTFTITVKASGATFDSLQGTISVSGPVQVVSFGAGSATWLPGKSPSNGGQFVGIVSATSSLTVATIKLKGTKEGSGSVSVSGARLARSGAEVGSGGGSTSFTIGRAPTIPGAITVTSSTHPDQNQPYEATTVEVSWTPPANGATGYSAAFDQNPETTPAQTANTKETTARQENLAIGVHYFHVRAQNADGWGPTAHFKITIKEPDAKVDETLAKPFISSVEKNDGFVTNIEAGTVSGFTVKGNGTNGYVAILSFEPKDRLPATLFEQVTVSAPAPTEVPTAVEGQPAIEPPPVVAPELKVVTGVKITPLMAEPAADGSWEIPINAAVPSGFYKVTVQGQQEKVLTPASDPVYVELSVADGGSVEFITADDLPKSNPISNSLNILGLNFSKDNPIGLVLALVILLGAAFAAVWGRRLYRRRNRTRNSTLN